jgi:hypothetical protein
MRKNGNGPRDTVSAVLAGLACFAAGLAAAQTSSWTVDRVLELAPGTSDALGEFASQVDLQEIVAERDYVFTKVDLNDDGQMELIVQAQSSAFCGSGGCFTLVLTRRGGQPVPLLRQNLAHGGLAITREKANGYRALAAVDANGKILKGDRQGTPMYGKPLVYELASTTP